MSSTIINKGTHSHVFDFSHGSTRVRLGEAKMRCLGCTKVRKAVAVLCPDCNTGGIIERRDGCGYDCRNGYILATSRPACCCSGPKDERCANCAAAGRGGSEIHACSRETDDEVDLELRLAMMQPLAREHRRVSAATASVLGQIGDKGVGERSPHRGK